MAAYKEKIYSRYYQIADIPMCIESVLPMTDKTFHAKFKAFEIPACRAPAIRLRHYFSLPSIRPDTLGREQYRKPPWAIYRRGGSWIYLGIAVSVSDPTLHRAVFFNAGHTRCRIYNVNQEVFTRGNIASLTLFPTDQILIARILADKQGCYIHSCGIDVDGQGMIFVGHSSAGKSTITRMFKRTAKILCDDRIIIRRRGHAYNIYGTWSHGDVPDVSADSAPLRAIFFLEKASVNRVIPLRDKKDAVVRLLSCLIKPFVTVDWWDKTLVLIEQIVRDIPCYVLKFDTSGDIVDIVRKGGYHDG